ncbi:MAG: HlyD family efflux transporter periplasmic adaptor subunit, partial [Chloroflexi bacterium]|nr:HlyD family efflux transporter periplasmic adaptor subunit [Chloroflexota bacterium]
VEVGEAVREQQEIARVRGPGGTEVLVAPWDGTITSLPVQVGDTVLPGALIATVGDLSRLQVETTDVDEFIIAYVRRGQAVTLSVDALDGRLLRGRVRSVALEPQRSAEGDEHYPVVIDLAEIPVELRPGMTVRVNFSP